MKIRTLEDVEAFKEVLSKCEGSVWLESINGTHYNLKSNLNQYIAMADLLRDKNEDLELYAQMPADKLLLMNFLDTLKD